jgi:hypothetical protein
LVGEKDVWKAAKKVFFSVVRKADKKAWIKVFYWAEMKVFEWADKREH